MPSASAHSSLLVRKNWSMGHKDDTEKSANVEPVLFVEFPLCSE